ncbi:MAG: Crp/Fnr family transcriptional regulator [Magnetococcales bacterium]|nr:Crp/Fnr family transcriptional regulator [Magnetococcales bacterium]
MSPAYDPLAPARESYLFAHLSEPAWQRLRPAFQRRRLESGALLFQQGDPFEHFFFVLSGGVKLFRMSAEGQEKVLEVVEPGATFAEAIMFSGGHRYPVNAEAVTESVLLAMPQKPYMELLKKQPELCFDLLAGMSRRLHGLVMEINRLTLLRARERLIGYLVRQAVPAESGGAVVKLPMTRKVLASRLSIQPETLSRLLGALKRAGQIREAESALLIPDPAALRALMAEENPDPE